MTALLPITATAHVGNSDYIRALSARHQIAHALAYIAHGYGFAVMSSEKAFVRTMVPADSCRGTIALAGQFATLIETIDQHGDQIIEQVIDRWTATIQHDIDRGGRMTPNDLLHAAGDIRNGLRDAYTFVMINKPLIDELADKLLAAEPAFWNQFDLYDALAGRRPAHTYDREDLNPHMNALFTPLNEKLYKLNLLADDLRKIRTRRRRQIGDDCLGG